MEVISNFEQLIAINGSDSRRNALLGRGVEQRKWHGRRGDATQPATGGRRPG